MTTTVIQKAFHPFKALLPRWLWQPIRGLVTAIGTPCYFSVRSGHFRAAIKMAAVDRFGEPIPWYTYPSIEFLKHRRYDDKVVLEFGGGQSTLWWANRAKHVVTLEGDQQWHDRIKSSMPQNVSLHYVTERNPAACVTDVEKALRSETYSTYDVIVIDGLWRAEMIDIAVRLMAQDGIIVADNSEGYGFYAGFKDKGLNRVDFFGHVPGVILPHCTSVFFGEHSFAFRSEHPIPVIA